MTTTGPLRNFIQLHARLLSAIGLGVLVALLIPPSLVHHAVGRFIIGWNVGASLYLILVARMMMSTQPERIRARAIKQDEGRVALLVGVIVAALVCIVAIVVELSVAHRFSDWRRDGHIALAVLTIVTSWAFTHIMFALHYAHEFYRQPSGSPAAGLLFPGTDQPTYSDFVYFAFVVGTSGQTADVSFTTSHMRRIGSAHCVIAFVFNTTILALTINIAASLLAA